MNYQPAFFDALIGPTIYSAPAEILGDIIDANVAAAESISPLDDSFGWLRQPESDESYEVTRFTEVG